MSRNRKKINDEYPELAQALIAQKADNFIIDGDKAAKEVVREVPVSLFL